MAGSTRAELREKIKKQYAESSSHWTTPEEIDQWIQDAHDDLARFAKYYKLYRFCEFVADQARYDVTDLLVAQVERVRIADSATATEYLDVPEMGWRDYLDATSHYDGVSGITNTGTPETWTWDGMRYLYLNPAPDYTTAGSGGTYCYGVKIYFAGLETLDDDADTTHLPRFAEKGVVFYALAQWHEKDQSPLQGYYLQQYADTRGRLLAWVKGTGRSAGSKRISTDDERPPMRI